MYIMVIDVIAIKNLIVKTAQEMAEDDIKINMQMGKNGSVLFNNNDTIMTHCNAGSLATVAYGTALGVIRATKESGKNVKVIATETRPVQQGSRLTAFELKHDGFDVSLIPDTAVGYTMANKLVNKVVVGADRVLRTGHVYNKIGTYQVALIAKQHRIPFYVAAPLSTFDMKSTPQDVIIEQRKGTEVTQIGDRKTAPDGINVINPAFDMTPPELISGIITEAGVAKPPLKDLGIDPSTSRQVLVKDGRFGMYVTDGETNATLRRGDTLEALDLDRANELLAGRRAWEAENGGVKVKKTRKKASKKS